MAKNLKVVLLGYMASGKSTVGRVLAERLGIDFIDLDDEIQKNVNKSIPQIFTEKGELFFRKKELEVLNAILDREVDFVLSLGGGTPCYGSNMDDISSKTQNSIYLKLNVGSLANRIAADREQRPLVAKISPDDLPEFVGKHLFERAPFYLRANHTITCDTKTIDEVVNEVTEILL